MSEKFGDTKGEIRRSNSKNKRQHNDKLTNNESQSITQQLKIEQQCVNSGVPEE